jgi:hypothetical protein
VLRESGFSRSALLCKHRACLSQCRPPLFQHIGISDPATRLTDATTSARLTERRSKAPLNANQAPAAGAISTRGLQAIQLSLEGLILVDELINIGLNLVEHRVQRF